MGKSRYPHLCPLREHDWEGEYQDDYLFLDCKKCDAKGIEYPLTNREKFLLAKGWWTVNDLYIRLKPNGKLQPWNKLQFESYSKPVDESHLQKRISHSIGK